MAREQVSIDQDAPAWLNASLARASDAILGVNAQGQVLFLNPVAETLLACTTDTVLGRQAGEIMRLTHENTGRTLVNPLLEALNSRVSTPIPPSSCLRGQGGREILIEGFAELVLSQQGMLVGSVLVFRDLSPRHRLEEGLRQAQKSDAVGRLRGGIAHDFNNLMTVVLGFSEMLLSKVRQGTAPAEFQEALLEIKTAAEKATQLTQQILALGRSQLLQMAHVDLNQLVLSIEKTLGRVVGERVRVTTKLAPDVPVVWADSVQIQQVLLHLTVNAREALPNGGEIVFATRRVETRGPGSQPELKAELSVCDNGLGMDAETLARAVEPCFSTKEGAKGMGLAVVEAILRNCGGNIHLESQPGKGAKAIVTLPASATQPASAPSLIVEPARSIPREAILVVEDADRVRKLLTRILEDAGYTIFQAADGRAGLELCKQHDGDIQLLLTDVIMPEMSGPELVKSLIDMKHKPRVLFLSGYTGDELQRQGIDQGQYHFLQKPFLGDALLRKVREVLEESRQ